MSASLDDAGGIGGLLARTDHQTSSTAYYNFDGNGNVTSLVNSNGAPVARYSYDPYGNILAMSGPLASVNLYRFSSKETHPNSGLVYYGYRFYDPNLQRWVNRDPIGCAGGLNMYNFAQNGPERLVDPLGLFTCGEWASIIGSGLAGAAEELGNLAKSPASEFAGAGYGWIGILGGGTLSYGHNATQIENHPLNNGDITLGHFISYDKSMGPNTPDPATGLFKYTYGQHEEQHTYQYEALGDWFFPVYGSLAAYNWATGGDWWKDNALEAGPNSCPPVP